MLNCFMKRFSALLNCKYLWVNSFAKETTDCTYSDALFILIWLKRLESWHLRWKLSSIIPALKCFIYCSRQTHISNIFAKCACTIDTNEIYWEIYFLGPVTNVVYLLNIFTLVLLFGIGVAVVALILTLSSFSLIEIEVHLSFLLCWRWRFYCVTIYIIYLVRIERWQAENNEHFSFTMTTLALRWNRKYIFVNYGFLVHSISNWLLNHK